MDNNLDSLSNAEKKPASSSKFSVSNIVILVLVFLIVFALLTVFFQMDRHYENNKLQRDVYSIIFAGLISSLVTFFMYTQMLDTPKKAAHSIKERPRWFFPLMSGVLALVIMSLSYMYMGVYPIGDRSTLTVDLHHQYAPLLAQLRTMLLEGKSLFYSFEVGLGTNFLPLFAYYLSSPFNALLLLFPANMLTEAILVITLLKNALTAVFFAMCVQYIFEKKGLHIVIVSVAYSMIMYLIAYSWNIMWLDVVMILPLVIMAYERMVRKGKYLLYILSLAYALFANYYLAFMLCIFLVLYHIAYLLREKRDITQIKKSTIRFVLSSAIGGGLVMFLLVPVALSLGQTSASGANLPDFKNNFAMFDLWGRHLFDTSPTIRSGNLPNIYSGIISVVLLPIFITLKEIPKRKRMVYTGLLAVVGFSFILNALDLFWHGLHAPNDLPYRFSFIYSFVLLLIAAETLVHIHKITPKQIATSLALFVAFCVFQEKFADDKYSFESIYVSLLLAVLYCGIIWLAKKKYLTVYATYALALIVVVSELTISGGRGFVALNSSEYFTIRNDYVASPKNVAISTAINRAKSLGDENSNGEFYRIEHAPRRTTIDPALFNYRGMSVFASSNPQAQVKLLGGLGYAINGVNSHLFNSFVPTMDSILGIKYLVLEDQYDNVDYLKKIDSITENSYTYNIYENTMALPIAFSVNSAIKGWSYANYDPIYSQNSFFQGLTGISENILVENTDVSVDETSENSATISGETSFSIANSSGQSQSSTFNITITQDGPAVAFVDCRGAKDIRVQGNGFDYSFSGGEPYVVNLGNMVIGDSVTIEVKTESDSTGNIYVSTIDSAAFGQHMDRLHKEKLVVTSFSETKINGTLSNENPCTIFTSIPFDSSWTVKVDGKVVDTYALNDSLLAFDVLAGEHDVEFSFFPKPLVYGLIISFISLAGLIVLLYATSKNKTNLMSVDDIHDATTNPSYQPETIPLDSFLSTNNAEDILQPQSEPQEQEDVDLLDVARPDSEEESE